MGIICYPAYLAERTRPYWRMPIRHSFQRFGKRRKKLGWGVQADANPPLLSALWQAPVQNAYLFRIQFPFVQAIREVIYSLKSGSPKHKSPFSFDMICSESSFCMALCELDIAPSLCFAWNSWEKGLL